MANQRMAGIDKQRRINENSSIIAAKTALAAWRRIARSFVARCYHRSYRIVADAAA